ncbi:MAG: peroxiredoxin [Halobacteriales archaeon]|nr:peroxiredoxin [Halobacteriales archaeon]
MVQEGNSAPDFTVPLVTADDLDEFTLSDALGDGPIVLAFFPGAFTTGCRAEMCDFRDSLGDFESLDASVYGISVDGPFSQQAFAEENDLNFPLLSDFDKEVIEAYDVVLESLVGIYGPVAERAVFVIDGDGEVTYRWVGDDPSVMPDVDEVREAVEAAS